MKRKLALTAVMFVLGCSGSGSGVGGGAGGGSGGGAGGGDAGPTKCGDGTLETDEVCENLELRGKTCVTEGYDFGTLRCSSSCTLDTSGCSKCGDGKISG